jgi:hypothetical protein
MAGSSTALLAMLDHLPRYSNVASASALGGVENRPRTTQQDPCPSPLPVKKLIKGWDATL